MVPPKTLAANSQLLAGLSWISVIRYGFRALVANEFEDVTFPGIKDLLNGGGKNDVTAKALLSGKMMQLEDLDIVFESVGLLVFCVAIASVSFWALKKLYKD